MKFLRHNEIDFKLWDEAISLSINELPYAYSWYLNAVSPSWSALVLGNYEFVMPLTLKHKFGINLFLQPLFTQQLGIFSSLRISQEIVNQFVKEIPIRNFNINLNEKNFCTFAEKLPNHLLSLSPSYEILAKNYSTNAKRNLKKSKTDLQIVENVSFDDFIGLCEQTLYWKKTYSEYYKKIFFAAKAHDAISILGAKSENGLCAAVALLKSKTRIIYHVAASNDDGKRLSAMFFLVDFIIKQNAGKEILLDFEGSKNAGIARFYQGFGAEKTHYYNIKKGVLIALKSMF